MISKNLYSLQNAQPFIFQLICMQLCNRINCFLKAHNKQLNQYYLNFTIFLPKNKVFKKWFGFGSGRVDPQKTRVGSRVNSFLLRVKKNRVRVEYFLGQVRSENSNPFCHVYFRVLNLLFREFFTQLYRGLFINKAHKAQCQKLQIFG